MLIGSGSTHPWNKGWEDEKMIISRHVAPAEHWHSGSEPYEFTDAKQLPFIASSG
jgi:transglutaminase/protease-like cytokinesis protein 3